MDRLTLHNRVYDISNPNHSETSSSLGFIAFAIFSSFGTFFSPSALAFCAETPIFLVPYLALLKKRYEAVNTEGGQAHVEEAKGRQWVG